MCARDADQERDFCEAAACGYQKVASQPPLSITAVTESGGASLPLAHLMLFLHCQSLRLNCRIEQEA